MLDETKFLNTQNFERPDARRNFQQALDAMLEKYPNLKEPILRSIQTPQLGEHHNEGEKMDAHLSLILQTLEDIKSGKFPEELSPQAQQLLQTAVIAETHEGKGIKPALTEYTFLHDIAKPDCLTLKLKGEKKGVEITWQQWQEIEQRDKPYHYVNADGSEVPIVSISYFHESAGSAGQHGNKGVEMLEGQAIPQEILVAISKHEVAYQFPKINAATYEEHFVKPGFSEEQQKFILAASYIDTMASLLPEGKPDLANFNNLLRSRDNYLLIQNFLDTGVKIRDNDLAAIKKQDRVLATADLEKIVIKKKNYNLGRLGQELDLLIGLGKLDADTKQAVLDTLTLNPDELGKKFGKLMKDLKLALEKSVE